MFAHSKVCVTAVEMFWDALQQLWSYAWETLTRHLPAHKVSDKQYFEVLRSSVMRKGRAAYSRHSALIVTL